LAYTTADYGSFRLIFTARMAPVNRDHLGVLFWGDRPKDPSKPKIDNAGWIQFMPPHGAMWDYHPPKHHSLPPEPPPTAPPTSPARALPPGARDAREGLAGFHPVVHDGTPVQPRDGHDAGGRGRRRDRPVHAPPSRRAQRPREADHPGPHRHVPPRWGRVRIQ